MSALSSHEVQFALWGVKVVETEVVMFGAWLGLLRLQLLIDESIAIYSLIAVPGIYVLTSVLVRTYSARFIHDTAAQIESVSAWTYIVQHGDHDWLRHYVLACLSPLWS